MEKLAAWTAPLAPYKLQIGLVVILLLILVYWFWFRDEKFDSKSGKKGKKKCKKCKKVKCKCKANSSRKNSDPEKDDEEDDDEDDDSDSNAQALYNIAHENLANDMGQDEFMQLAGNMGSPIIYIHLKQLYTVARSDGKDPLKTVTVEDYERVLKNS